MNITEANAINTVLRYVLNAPDLLGHVPTHEDAERAAADLADKAHKPLMAGLTGDDVHRLWPALLLDNGSSDDDDEPTVTITRDQVECWVGVALTDDEVAEIDDAVPNSSIPDAIAAIGDSVLARRDRDEASA